MSGMRAWRRGMLVLLLASSTVAVAQGAAGAWDPRSGDPWIDARLADINEYASRWPGPFADEVVRYLGAPRSLVDELMQRGWPPGDIYYACSIAQAAGRPCRAVADDWAQHRGEGWGVIAQRFGIAPGSPAFHALKRGFVPSYDRWGRPVPLDAALRAEFPGRDGAVPEGLPEPPPGHGRGKPEAGRHGPPARPPGQGKGHGRGHG